MAVIIPLIEPSQHAGLTANQSKTRHMNTSRGKDKITQQYIIERNQFERVNEFTYLGTQINAQNKRSEEIKKEYKPEIDVWIRKTN
jgi:hypothetical protein